MKIRQPYDLSRNTPLDRKTLYARVVFWVFLVILSLEIVVLATAYYIFYEKEVNLVYQTVILIGIGCLISTMVTIAVIAVLHWYILLHTPSDCVNSEESQELLIDLFHAIENQDLEVYFQPQIDLKTDKLVGCETLVRWNHPVRGLISPADFVPLAEQSGLILAMGRWVLETSCKQAMLWANKGLQIRIAVNLSPLQVKSDIINTVRDILKETNLPPEYLELEITETTLTHNIDDAIDVMRRLKELGIIVSMDDFGTGYSSLASLDKFPIQKLKIDKAFVHKITPYDEEPNLADSIIKMGHQLNLKILAEGIETEYQKKYFTELGADEAQGYLFGEPMNSRKFYKYLKSADLASDISTKSD